MIIQANLVEFHSLVLEISLVRDSVTPTRTPTPTGSTLKPICPPSPLVGDIIIFKNIELNLVTYQKVPSMDSGNKREKRLSAWWRTDGLKYENYISLNICLGNSIRYIFVPALVFFTFLSNAWHDMHFFMHCGIFSAIWTHSKNHKMHDTVWSIIKSLAKEIYLKRYFTTQNLLRITFTMSCQHFRPKHIFKFLVNQCWKLIQRCCLKVSLSSLLHFFNTCIGLWVPLNLAVVVNMCWWH